MKTEAEAPFCKCGCGKPTIKARNGSYNQFLHGHNPKHSKSSQRSKNGLFASRNTFGKGRPQGSRNKVTVASLNLLENEGQTLTRKAIDLALNGSVPMLKFCLERLVPVKRSDKITLPNMPKVTNVASASQLTGYVLEAVTSGKLSPADGEVVSRACERHLRALQVGDLEARLAELEEKLQGKG